MGMLLASGGLSETCSPPPNSSGGMISDKY